MTREKKMQRVPGVPSPAVEGQRVRIVGGAYDGVHGDYVRAHATNGWHYVRVPTAGIEPPKIVSVLAPAVELAPLPNKRYKP